MTIYLEVIPNIVKDLVKQLLEAEVHFIYVSKNYSLNISEIIYFNSFEDSNGKQYHIELAIGDKQYGINIHQDNILKFRVTY